jgi:hypothetical protein
VNTYFIGHSLRPCQAGHYVNHTNTFRCLLYLFRPVLYSGNITNKMYYQIKKLNYVFSSYICPVFLLFDLRHYSPFWTLASSTFLHNPFRSPDTACQFLIVITSTPLPRHKFILLAVFLFSPLLPFWQALFVLSFFLYYLLNIFIQF